MCRVHSITRTSATKSGVSQPLSAASVRRRAAGGCSSIMSRAAFRSASWLGARTSVSTMNPWRFSVSTLA